MLVDGAVDVSQFPGDFDVGFVDEPASTDSVAAGSGGIDQQRSEALDPLVDRDVIDLDATLDQELFNVAIGESRQYRRYQRTAIMMTSGGNRYPANAEQSMGGD